MANLKSPGRWENQSGMNGLNVLKNCNPVGFLI
jgi:hypothetical protein